MIDINTDDLFDWSCLASHMLQHFCDEAQDAAGDPYGDGELRDVRWLLAELDRIHQGLPAWQARVDAKSDAAKLWESL